MSTRNLAPRLALLAFIGFWAGSWHTPLFDLDEGAFSQATLEMLASGNYLTTTLDGAPRYDKPMLAYWLQGMSVAAFGAGEFAFRLPSMVAASLWMLLVFAFVRSRSDSAQAPWLAAGSLALSLMPGVIGHAATADAVLNVLIAATLLDIWRFLEGGGRTPVLRAYLWMGLGALAKGPVAIAIPLLASLGYALWGGRLRDWLRGAFEWRGWLVLLAVVAPWTVACWLADGGEFIRHFLLDHNVNRYGSTLQGHGGTLWYYVAVLPLVVLPFTALLPGALRRGLLGDALDRYCLVWFAVVFAVFSASKTQLPHYLLYGATPLFVLFGRMAPRLPARGWLLAPAAALLLTFTLLPWLLPLLPIKAERAWESGIIGEALAAFDWRYSAVCVAALAVLVAATRLRTATSALLVGSGATSAALWWAVVPVLAQAQQAPTREAAIVARQRNQAVVTWATHLPTFSVYRGAATPHRLPESGELVFVRADKLPALRRALGSGDDATLVDVFRKGGVLLLERAAPTLHAGTAAPPGAPAAAAGAGP